jgi:glutathione S-transferase
MKLYWSSRSPFVRKVMIAAHELGLADRIETIPVVVALAQPNADVMAVNPLNKIPTLVTDDGTVLFDSAAICEYLDSLHGGGTLFPAAPAARWSALRWHALGNGMLDALILWRTERTRPEAQRSQAMLDAFARKIEATLALLEREAADLAAAPVTIGAIGVGAALGYLDFRFADVAWRTGRPRLAAWYETFAQLPSMRATSPHD